jgi:two-component system, sensor histidine kinase RpfC
VIPIRAIVDWVRARLANRADTEHKQVLVRIVITALFSTYLGWLVGVGGSSEALFAVWLILLGELLVSLLLFGAILYRPDISHWRRWVGMLSDYAAIGAVMALLGEIASPLYSSYLWVTIGNGLRFGSRYLYFATALATLSFFTMSQVTPYWHDNPYLSSGLLIGAAAVPLYFASLLKALTRAIQEARRANEAKSRFLANMSHELRTPLNGILAMAELLAASKLRNEQRESADMIHTSAQTLLLLIDEVLDISAIEAGKMRRYEEDFDLPQLLSRVYRMLHPQAQAKSLELNVDTDIRVPQLLYGDASHLTQILLNLLQNAVKFTHQGSVGLHVRELSRNGNSIMLRISVRDTGIGIPEEARSRIFRPFEQVDSGRDRRFGGSGLGTTIAKSLTELMGGRIGVEPNAGGGTHFWVELPFRLVDAGRNAPMVLKEAEVEGDGNGERRRIDGSGNIIDFEDPFLRHRVRVRSMRVLVADDQPANRVVLQRLLEKAGHRTLFAEDGERVLDILSEETPDLVLLDLHMPGLSGLEVIRQARVMQAGQPRRTPIVVLSADATVESMREAERAGARVYLTKPISVPKLLDTIAGIVAGMEDVAMATAAQSDSLESTTNATAAPSVDSNTPILEELAAMGLGQDFLQDFVEQCLRDIGRSMSNLQQAASNADYEAMREAAHAMRGVAENIGAMRLVERCRIVMRLDSVQLAKQSVNLTRDLDQLVEQTAREVRAQLPSLLGGGRLSQDPVPGSDPG